MKSAVSVASNTTNGFVIAASQSKVICSTLVLCLQLEFSVVRWRGDNVHCARRYPATPPFTGLFVVPTPTIDSSFSTREQAARVNGSRLVKVLLCFVVAVILFTTRSSVAFSTWRFSRDPYSPFTTYEEATSGPRDAASTPQKSSSCQFE